jgi:hypothetical protein
MVGRAHIQPKGSPMRLIVCFALLLAGCAPAAPVGSSAPASLKSAAGEVKSWGATLRRWTVDEAGRVEHVSGEKVGGNRTDIMIETRRTTLSRAQQDELAAAIGKVEAVLHIPEHCDQMLTDGPYGTLQWDRGDGVNKLPFNGNCVRGRDYDLVSAIFAADQIVDDAAKATDPVERHPLQQ